MEEKEIVNAFKVYYADEGKIKKYNIFELLDECTGLQNQLQQYKQQIDELEKWLVEEIARLDIELGNTFGTHGIIIKEKYDLRDAYTKVLSKLKEGDEK